MRTETGIFFTLYDPRLPAAGRQDARATSNDIKGQAAGVYHSPNSWCRAGQHQSDGLLDGEIESIVPILLMLR